MPIYESICIKCDTRHEYVSSIANCAVTPVCCGKSTEKRIFSPPTSHFDIQPWDSFVSPATGKVISSKAQRREDMKASGCRDWEGLASEKSVAAAKNKELDAKETKSLKEATAKTLAQMSPEKKKILLSS